MLEDLINSSNELRRHISRVRTLADAGGLTLSPQEEILLETLHAELVRLEEFATRQLGVVAKRVYL